MINVGVIGCGYWGPNIVRNFRQIDNCNLKWCSDLSESRIKHMKGLYPSIKFTKDYNDILNDKEIGAVVIATPVSTHFKIGMDALMKGKHILIEKPITHSSEDAKKLIEVAAKNKKILMVDHTMEYSPAVKKIKEYIEKGELGQVLTVDMIRVNLGVFQKDVNVIWDLIPHDISILVYLLGLMPEKVISVGESYIQKSIEDDAHLTLKFKNKITAHIHVSWLDPCKIRKTTIVGRKKMLVFDDLEPTEKIRVYDKGVTIEKNGIPIQNYYDTFGEYQLLHRSGDIFIPKIETTEPLNNMCRHFLDCIENGKTPVSDGQSGLRVVRVVEAAQESLRNNSREVEIRAD